MKAIVLNAGQGSRLLPLTADRPKCLLSVGGRTLLEWQLTALAEAGVREVVEVVGFGADRVRAVVQSRLVPGLRVRLLENRHYRKSDNLISCWMARNEMTGDFYLLNGDTLFEPAVLKRLRQAAPSTVAVAVDHKDEYDSDDMKVHCRGNRLLAVGKTLPPEQTDAESIGVILFRGDGPRKFRTTLDRIVRHESATRRWYLSAIDEMAREGCVSVVPIDGLQWTEVDYPHDLEKAHALAAAWMPHEQKGMAAALVG